MKVGLVCEGGGMKCAYGAGVLDAFIDNKITFDYCIGVSAGAANTLSFMAGQRGRNRRFYVDHIDEPMYFGVKSLLKTGNIFNLGFIYGELTNTDGPDFLDYDAIMANPAEFELVCTNANTGEAEYFSKNDLIKDNYIHVMASCAIPAVSKAKRIDQEYYYDGGLSDSLPVKRAFDMGCDRVVVVTTKPRDYRKSPEKFKLLYSILCRKYPKAVECLNNRYIMYNNQLDYMYGEEKAGRVLVIAPSRAMKSGTYAMDKEENQRFYELGLEDFKAQKTALCEFMRDS